MRSVGTHQWFRAPFTDVSASATDPVNELAYPNDALRACVCCSCFHPLSQLNGLARLNGGARALDVDAVVPLSGRRRLHVEWIVIEHGPAVRRSRRCIVIRE